jgi:hypothetical protein
VTTALLLTAEELVEEYIGIAFSNGFSKGTANVDPHDMKKLAPLLKYYAKKPKPFTACVRDNRKRFGPRTEAICAVVKDLIFHSTKWRNKRDGGKAQLSSDEVQEFILDKAIPDEFIEWLAETTEDELEEYARLSQGEVILEVPENDEEIEVDFGGPILAEMYFADGEVDPEDGLIWKTILREGVWKMSPGPGQKPVSKPLTVIKTGKSDPDNLIVSMSELARNYKADAVEHVQIPLSHTSGVKENTGFTRDLRMVKGKDGKWEMQAALDFTEPDIKGMAERGTIANTSAGILFNFLRKEDGKKFGAVLDHVALTNRPWLNGLSPFGTSLSSDDVEMVTFAEDGVELAEPLYELRGAADSLRRAIRMEDDEAEKEKLMAALDGVVDVLARCEKDYGPSRTLSCRSSVFPRTRSLPGSPGMRSSSGRRRSTASTPSAASGRTPRRRQP